MNGPFNSLSGCGDGRMYIMVRGFKKFAGGRAATDGKRRFEPRLADGNRDI